MHGRAVHHLRAVDAGDEPELLLAANAPSMRAIFRLGPREVCSGRHRGWLILGHGRISGLMNYDEERQPMIFAV